MPTILSEAYDLDFRNRCHYCNQDFWIDFITRDHVVPRYLGGVNARWNIVPACVPCNTAKDSSRPTCECEFCVRSVARHGDRVQVLSLARRRNYDASAISAAGGEACPKCGCITMTPDDCPWCD
jgi:hypothetical protein